MQRFLFALLVLPLLSSAQTHDTSFAPMVTAPSTVTASIRQTDNKLILAGTMVAIGSTRVSGGMLRLNSDGTVDNSFTVAISANNRIQTLALQPDGKILVGGAFTTFNDAPANRLVRLNSDGTVDNSFAVGTETTNNPIEGLAIQTDNKIVVAGAFTTFNGMPMKSLARLNPDGTLDTSFTPPSIEFLGPGSGDGRMALRVQPDGKILFGSYFTHVGGVERKYLVRLLADGTLDQTFMSNLGSGTDNHITSIDLQSDGKIIIGGRFTKVNSAVANRNQVARLNTDGTLDGTFNADAGFNNGNSVQTVTVVAGDQILVGGSFSAPRNRLVRLTSDGALDTSFDTGLGFQRNSAGFGEVKQLFVQSDSKLLAIGLFESFNENLRINVARLTGSGSLDDTYAPNPAGPGRISKVQALGDGKVLICGNFWFVNGVPRQGIARLLSSGSLDTSFAFSGMTFSSGEILTFGRLSTGKLILGGSMSYSSGPIKSGLLRVNEDGTFDNTYSGFTGLDRQYSTDGVYAIEVLDDDKIIVGGRFTSINGTAKANLAKLNADGSLDNSFHASGSSFPNRIVKITHRTSDGKSLLVEDVGTDQQFHPLISLSNASGSPVASFSVNSKFNGYYLTDALFLPDGKIVISGDFSSYDGTPVNRLVKVDESGVLDPSFRSPYTNDSYLIRDLYYVPELDRIYVGKDQLNILNTPSDANYFDIINAQGMLLEDGIQVVGAVHAIAPLATSVLLSGEIRQVNATEVSAIAKIDIAPPPVGVPTGLQLTTQNLPRKITVSWVDSSSDETGYEIQRSTGNNTNYNSVAIVAANTNTYTNQEGLTGSTQYFFRVRAVNLGGQTAFSSEASISTLVPEVVKTPSQLVASVLENNAIALSWYDSTVIETAYQVFRSPSADGVFTLKYTGPANTVSYVDFGLLPNTTYFYKVRAIADDPSAFSNVVSQTTLPAPPNEWAASSTTPLAGRSDGVALTIGGKGYVGLGRNASGALKDWWEYDAEAKTWTRKTDFPGTARIGAIGFTIGLKGYVGTGNDFSGGGFERDFYEYDPAANSWVPRADFPEDFTSEAGITSGVAFSIGNFGYAGLGNNGVNNPKAFHRYDPATNAWTAVADFGGAGRPGAVGFAVEGKGYVGFGYNGLSAPLADMWQYDPTANSWMQKSSFPGVGRGGAAVATIKADAFLLAGDAGTASSTVYTNANSLYRTNFGNWTTLTPAPFSNRTGVLAFTIGKKIFVFGGVNGTTYHADLHTFSPTSAQVPDKPQSATATFVSETALKLEWVDSSPDETNFVIELSHENGLYMAVASVTAGTTVFNQTGLATGKNYQFRVKAINAFGASEYTYSNTVKTQGLPPAPPTNFRLVSSTQSQVELGWDDNSLNETGFEVLKRNASSVFEVMATVDANVKTYIDATTAPQVQYAYRVRAKNTYGTSPEAELAVLVALIAPEAPSDLTAVIQPGTKVLLNWKDNSAYENGFDIYRNNELLKSVSKNTVTYMDESFLSTLEYSYQVKATNSAGASQFSNAASITFPPGTITGLEETVRTLVTAFPNPVADRLYLDNHTDAPVTVSICNSLGQTIFADQLEPHTTRVVSSEAWASGLYLLRTATKNQPLLRIVRE